MDKVLDLDPKFKVSGGRLSRNQVAQIVRAVPKASRIMIMENTEKYLLENYGKSGWTEQEKRHISREVLARAVLVERSQPWLKEFLLTNDDTLLGNPKDYVGRCIKTLAINTCIEDAHHSLIRDGLASAKPVSSLGIKPYEKTMQYIDRLTVHPIIDGMLNRGHHTDPSDVGARFWSAKLPILGEYYISKLFFAAIFWVFLSWAILKLMPAGVTDNDLYNTLRTPITRVFDPKATGDLPSGNGSYYNPVLIANLSTDPEVPGLRCIDKESLPVMQSSMFHQAQANILDKFVSFQDALGVRSRVNVDITQEDRDIPDWVGNRYLYFTRGLNRAQAEAAVHSGLEDINRRRLFNWEVIASSPVATHCDLNTLKDLQKHAAKLDTIPFRQSFVQSCFYQSWRDRKRELDREGIPFANYVIDKQYEDFLRGAGVNTAQRELTKVAGLTMLAALAARLTYARMKIVSYIKHPADRRANKFRYFGRADRVFVDSATTRFINSTFASQRGLVGLKLLNIALMGVSMYIWVYYLSTNRSPCLNDSADGWFVTYLSWWKSLVGSRDPVYDVITLVERVLIKDLYIKDGNLYFYDNGGPLLNCNSSQFNHMASHKKWFLSVNDKNWDPSGQYTSSKS